jgi:hypothetical protein
MGLSGARPTVSSNVVRRSILVHNVGDRLCVGTNHIQANGGSDGTISTLFGSRADRDTCLVTESGHARVKHQ